MLVGNHPYGSLPVLRSGASARLPGYVRGPLAPLREDALLALQPGYGSLPSLAYGASSSPMNHFSRRVPAGQPFSDGPQRPKQPEEGHLQAWHGPLTCTDGSEAHRAADRPLPLAGEATLTRD